jgi:lipoyl(octanoyl) transferase
MIDHRALKFVDLGRISYAEALEIQREAHSRVLSGKENDTVLICEHNHVFTLGKSADISNLLIKPSFLESIGAELFETDRGGDITYHGPGQIVVYPILHLSSRKLGVRKYVDLLETAIIRTLLSFGILAYQIPDFTGIWIKTDSGDKKLGAIGIRVSRGVSMHGFALNIRTNLRYFDYIIPCGIADMEVTSLSREGIETNVAEFSEKFKREFSGALLNLQEA